MNEKVYRILEFDKIIDMLVAKADSAPAKELCRKLRPGADLTEITKAQENTSAALTRLFRQDRLSFAGCTEIRPVCRALEIERALSAADLIRIADILECAQRVYAYGNPDAKDSIADCLTPYFEQLVLLPDLNREIRRCILSAEELADDASAKLSSIRRNILSINNKIHDKLAEYVNSSLRPYLQDAVVTMRDSRYCIPVKAEYKGQVTGIVHDQSSTGSTLFIEPAAIVEYNNKIRQLEIEEQEEIAAILAALSARAAEHTAEILNNAKLLTKLDFIFAKAALAMDMNATMPIFNDEHIIDIRKGRHPLLDRKQVVPIDVRLGEDFDLLIVTGPNTGGKTVSLKTVGLLTLMGQAGLHIPAADRSRLGIFKDVFADIGDEQSIEQSLSTFSSHMTNIVQILKNARENSLCLFDELGAGTDPTEGAALAIAILNYLHDRGIRTMATTHYSELKVYALSTDFVENACCEFNVETLRPTYRLLIGIPGKSNAFAISRRLGLPDHIIDSARLQISAEKESFEDLIADLENSKVTIEKEEEEIRSYRKEIEKLKNQLEAKQEKLNASREKILQEAHAQARDILQEAKDTADETIRAFQKAGPGASMKELEASRQKLRKQIDDKNNRLSIKAEPKPRNAGGVKASDLKPGDAVKILSMGLKGTVNSLPDHKGNLFIQCGIIRTQANINDLVLLQENDVTGPANLRVGKTGTGKMKMSKSLSVSTEINLLGLTTDEALARLDKYLDDAYLAHLPSVRIVHGKGTGALRNAVQQHLRRVRYVESFRLGEFGEGDAGVTIATFKK